MKLESVITQIKSLKKCQDRSFYLPVCEYKRKDDIIDKLPQYPLMKYDKKVYLLNLKEPRIVASLLHIYFKDERVEDGEYYPIKEFLREGHKKHLFCKVREALSRYANRKHLIDKITTTILKAYHDGYYTNYCDLKQDGNKTILYHLRYRLEHKLNIPWSNFSRIFDDPIILVPLKGKIPQLSFTNQIISSCQKGDSLYILVKGFILESVNSVLVSFSIVKDVDEIFLYSDKVCWIDSNKIMSFKEEIFSCKDQIDSFKVEENVLIVVAGGRTYRSNTWEIC